MSHVPILSTSRTARRALRRCGAAVAGGALLLLAVVGLAAPAGALVPVPEPAASLAVSCGPDGGLLTVVMTNTSTTIDAFAHFSVEDPSLGSSDHVVAPKDTETFVLDLPEGLSGTVTVTADFGVVAQQSYGPVDCYTYTAELVPRCSGSDAFLDLHVARLGSDAGTIFLIVDHAISAQQAVVGSWDHSLAVPTDVPLDVAVTNYYEGELASRVEPVSCPQAVVAADGAAMSGPDESADLAGVSPAGVSPAAVALPVDATLPVTGSSTGALASTGAVLLVGGLGAWVLARRGRRSPVG